MSTTTWRALWIEAAAALGGTPEAAVEARWLCEEASGRHGAEWAAGLDTPPTTRHVAHVDAMVARRRAGEPVQYVLGSWGFRHLDLLVDRRVLIPRPETEQLVDVALEELAGAARPLTVADLGTGSGAIALSLARELPLTGVEIWATDISPAALDVARANLAGLGRSAANVRLVEGDWYEALPAELAGRLAAIVSNPPYVADDEVLEASVHEWEPASALLAGPDGLDAIRLVIGEAPRWLRPGGVVVVEIGAAHGRTVADLAAASGLVDVAVRPDLAGQDRVLSAKRPGSAC